MNDYILEALFITSWGIGAISLATQILLSHLLFRSLKRSRVAYYKSIGEPIVFMSASLSDTEELLKRKYIRGLRGGFCVYRMIFRGIPKSFPKDVSLRRLAGIIRIVSVIMLVSFVAFIVVGYLFYKSGL